MINVLTCSSAAWPPHRLPLSPRLLFVDRCLSHHRRVSFITTVSMFSYLLIRFLFGPWYQIHGPELFNGTGASQQDTVFLPVNHMLTHDRQNM
jgi:hypothetical protein